MLVVSRSLSLIALDTKFPFRRFPNSLRVLLGEGSRRPQAMNRSEPSRPAGLLYHRVARIAREGFGMSRPRIGYFSR